MYNYVKCSEAKMLLMLIKWTKAKIFVEDIVKLMIDSLPS